MQFTVTGVPCIGLNGGPIFKHTEAFSFQVATDTQDETDRLWDAIVNNGGLESQCGWCKDKWGQSWQISPRVLTDAVTNKDPAVAKRAAEEEAAAFAPCQSQSLSTSNPTPSNATRSEHSSQSLWQAAKRWVLSPWLLTIWGEVVQPYWITQPRHCG